MADRPDVRRVGDAVRGEGVGSGVRLSAVLLFVGKCARGYLRSGGFQPPHSVERAWESAALGARKRTSLSNGPSTRPPTFCATTSPPGLLLDGLSHPTASSTQRLRLPACPLCGGSTFRPVVTVESHPVVRCRSCDLQLTNPQPSDAELAAIYGPDYVLAADDSPAHAVIVRSKRATADHYLDLLVHAGAPQGAKLLEIGCGAGNFLLQATQRGYDVTGVEYSPYACARARQTLGGVGRVLQGEIEVVAAEIGTYDIVVLCDVIEHVRQPADFLRKVLTALRPGGLLLVVTPSTASWSARIMGRRWMELKPEHLFYFSPATLTRQLNQTGFQAVALHRGTKLLSLDYVTAHFEKYPVAGIRATLRLLRAIVPAAWSQRPVRIVASGIIALARKPANAARP